MALKPFVMIWNRPIEFAGWRHARPIIVEAFEDFIQRGGPQEEIDVRFPATIVLAEAKIEFRYPVNPFPPMLLKILVFQPRIKRP
jgi:hypothetical protein